jgi:hypothetical protein
MTLEEAAAYLKLAPSSLQAGLLRGEVPGRQIAGEWRLHQRAIDDWLATTHQPR